MSWIHSKKEQEKITKHARKGGNLFKKSKIKGYVNVHVIYLIEQIDWIKKNTTQKDNMGASLTVTMVEHLLTWMAMRKKPAWMFGVDEKDYKNWIDLEKGHWLVDEKIRPELIRKKLI